jgi:hypothetical protein
MEHLPLEISKHVISYLDNKSRRKLRAASTQWFKYTDYRNFTLYFTRETDLPAICSRLSQYELPIAVAFKKHFDIKFNVFAQHITQITSLTELDLPDFTPPGNNAQMGNEHVGEEFRILSRLSNLKRLGPSPSDKLEGLCSTGFDLVEICENFCNLTSLHALPNTKISYGRINYPSLNKLAMILRSNTNMANLSLKYNAMVLDQPFANLFTNNRKLTKLTIWCGTIHNHVPCNLYDQLSNLKTLKCHDGGRQIPAKESNLSPYGQLTNLEKLSYTARSAMMDTDKLVNLTKLTLSNLYQSIEADWSKLFMSLSALTKLKEISLNLQECQTKPYESDYMFLSALPHLERVRIIRDQDQIVQPVLQYLTSPHLTRLYVDSQTPMIYDNIKPLSSLQELSISWTHDDDTQTSALETLLLVSAHLTKLDYLSFPILDDQVRVIESMSNLRHLSYSYTGNDLKTILNLARLQKLECLSARTLIVPAELQHCQNLTLFNGILIQEAGTDYMCLTKLPLKSLTLQFPITDEKLLHTIGQMTSLVALGLTGITDEQSTALRALHNLTKLHTRKSKTFTGRFLGTLTSLQELLIDDATELNANKELNLPYLISKY